MSFRPPRMTNTPTRAQTPTRSRSSLGSAGSSTPVPSSLSRTRTAASSTVRRPMTPRVSLASPGSGLRSRSSMSNINTPIRASSSLGSIGSQTYQGTIKVSVRPRPLSETASSTGSWNINKQGNIIANVEAGEFQYDKVFLPDADNSEIYRDVVEPVLEKCLQGYNGTVFAYGMTGSGKTHSMQGSETENGLIQLCATELFRKLNAEFNAFKVGCSYLEIYNEKLIDLLNFDGPATDDLRIRDDPTFGIRVVGLSEHWVASEKELIEVFERGDSARKTSCTNFNDRSSRSHAVLLMRVEMKQDSSTRHSTVCLCDLAGSEKASSQSERRKEGAFINKSLLALSTVIQKLSQGSFNHIPYRDSKLTRLLQPSLSGESIVSILCTIHLSSSTLSETINTLRFAARAKNILMNVRRNEQQDTDKDRYEQLVRENERQKQEIEDLKREQVGKRFWSGSDDDSVAQLTAENRILNERLEHLKRLHDTENVQSAMECQENLQQLLQFEVSDPRFSEIVASLERQYKMQICQIEEMKSYISHLENQLRRQMSVMKPGISVAGNSSDKDEEIADLKRQLKSKDSIISALRQSTKVRETISGSSERREKLFLRPIENTIAVQKEHLKGQH
ncbi:hypothetical protein KL933_002522 [Ogataea haglerorum]|uniref:Kinesin-like protein n=1 Tax=Ogataea haglerorum TaxID=1937702 RepID=A0AAN6D6I8_9ASCO|nr:uncharacterized protein KL911_003152 [Ogataea haglerorum]KAG7695892.1 hypothetical protein KL951_003417 [Ogataea haglerorum]KAG7718405.1 hypothetical protein KL913_002400 [Ogataea haglerorum]KAG7718746.1 hypothetical protein KL949_002742 [Ogataea haglerorum]KAG7727588.1 hypothetical protein KL933_002522 [Ogataea haglerorum]KAG7747379.1 hypothetical protein KL912_003403 [Ogataea haglerorum]